MSETGSFEAHGLSDLERLPPETRFECGVCWRVYDPHEGDDYWQIAPGTPFAALPEHWTCPNCDTPREKFVPLDRAGGLETRLAELAGAYTRAAETTMKGLPTVNPALKVETIGFRPWEEGWLGIVISPWFMNVTILPNEKSAYAQHREGTEIPRVLPSGEYVFVTGRLEGAGPLMTCSLFSPMGDFASHEAARETAFAALVALFSKDLDSAAKAAEEALAAEKSGVQDRRTLFVGRAGGA